MKNMGCRFLFLSLLTLVWGAGCKTSSNHDVPDSSQVSDIASGSVLFWVESGNLIRGECKNGLPALRINCGLNTLSHPLNSRFDAKWAELSGNTSPKPSKVQYEQFQKDRNAKLGEYEQQLAKIDTMIKDHGSSSVLEGQKAATRQEMDKFAAATKVQLEALEKANSYGEFVMMALTSDIVFNANTNAEMAAYKPLIDTMNKTLNALERGYLCQANLDRVAGNDGYIPHYISGYSRDRAKAASNCQASYNENYFNKKSRNHNESCGTACQEVYRGEIPAIMSSYVRQMDSNRGMHGVLVPTRY